MYVNAKGASYLALIDGVGVRSEKNGKRGTIGLRN